MSIIVDLVISCIKYTTVPTHRYFRHNLELLAVTKLKIACPGLLRRNWTSWSDVSQRRTTLTSSWERRSRCASVSRRAGSRSVYFHFQLELDASENLYQSWSEIDQTYIDMAIHFTPEVYRDYYENISRLNFLINEFSFNEY